MRPICLPCRWYLDLCSPTISIVDFKPVKPYPNYTDADWDALRKKTACQYTSDAFRRAELTLLEKGEQLYSALLQYAAAMALLSLTASNTCTTAYCCDRLSCSTLILLSCT
jgi:hypothetical protein